LEIDKRILGQNALAWSYVFASQQSEL